MMYNVAPFITTIIAYPLLGETVTLKEAISLVVAFCGIVLMLLGGVK
jgi:drug/metabolite transporter (DMT)-like permease